MTAAICRARRNLLHQSSSVLARSLSSSSAAAACYEKTFPLNHRHINTNGSNSHFLIQPLPSQTIRFKSALPSPSEESTTNLTPFLLADIGEGITEVELLQWYVTPDSPVSQFDRICQVQSDKASVEITSRYDGVVKELCAEVGGVVKVGQPLCFLETEGGKESSTLNNSPGEDRLSVPMVASDYSELMDRYEEESFVSDDATLAENNGGRFDGAASKVLSSPAVRKLGKEHNIDLSTVKGSGPNGRVLKSDVMKLIHQSDVIGGAADLSMPTASSTPALSPTMPTTLASAAEEDEIIPIRGYHRLMVKSMTSSLSVPHMVYTDEVNVSALQNLRSTIKPLAIQKGIKLTLLPFFLKAASLALQQFPMINGSIDVEKMELRIHKRHDLGVAVDTPRGLVVVAVRGCEMRSVEEIAMELGRLFALATEGNLTEEDISNPTFTLSNIGAIGGTYMSPIVLPPQVAIGAMGKIQRLPRFIDDSSTEVEAVQIMPISWGGDHRAIDGATMARFSNAWKFYVENPQAMMFEMR